MYLNRIKRDNTVAHPGGRSFGGQNPPLLERKKQRNFVDITQFKNYKSGYRPRPKRSVFTGHT